MLLQMGFQEMIEGNLSSSYERLRSVDEQLARPRGRWLKKLNKRFKGFRVSRARKLNWKAFSVVLWPRKIAGIYADIIIKILKIDCATPGIIFTCQLGLPVLSHSTAKCRRNALCFDRKPSLQ